MKNKALYIVSAICIVIINFASIRLMAQTSKSKSGNSNLELLKTDTKSKTKPSTDTKKTVKKDDTALPSEGKPQKKRKRFSPLQVYQNITVRYNYYYNARLKMNLALERVKTGHTDDYSKILTFYPEEAEGSASAVEADMDEVIKKTSTAIQFHNASVWKPDCYFLMGRAYYYKKDYVQALEVFQFIQTQFKIKVVKGVPIETKKIFHQPITNEALLWLIKTYIQMEKFNEADAVIAEVESRKFFPSKLRDELKILHTYLNIKKKDYKNAIPQLNQALKLTNNKKIKTRYTYILAQVHEEADEKMTAIKYYKQVLLMKPDFTMDFNARRKIVELYNEIEGSNTSEARGLLLGMLNDKEFEDYWDEVYYMLANIELKNKNEKQAIAYLKQSINYSTINPNQKGLSFEKLGDIYYKKSQYVMARNRYDSTLRYLPPTHEDYIPVKERKEVLDEVVNRLKIIQKQDSLQKLAMLDPSVLKKRIEKSLMAKREKALNDSLNKITNQQANTDNKQNGQNEESASWYFYNPAMKAAGYTDFIRKWGTRPLADNWRRLNKQSVASAPAEQENKPEAAKPDDANAPKTELEKALADVPNTPDKQKKSDEIVINAYYELANLYKSKLKNDKKSIETFEKLLERYPNNKYKVECYYNLYLLYDKLPDYGKAELYKNKILDQFPNSTFAKIIKDPDYNKKQNKKEAKLNKYYEATFELYTQANYTEAIANCIEADSIFKDNKLKPKFDLIKALCIGKTQPIEQFTASLQKIIGAYPNTDVKTRAQDILNLINNPRKETAPSADNQTADGQPKKKKKSSKEKTAYLLNTSVPHYVLVGFTKISSKNSTVMGQISNYNEKNHSIDNYETDQEMLNGRTQLFIIKQFKNADDATDYLDEIDNNLNLFKPLLPDDYQTVAISVENYSLLLESGELGEYRVFYEENYNR